MVGKSSLSSSDGDLFTKPEPLVANTGGSEPSESSLNDSGGGGRSLCRLQRSRRLMVLVDMLSMPRCDSGSRRLELDEERRGFAAAASESMGGGTNPKSSSGGGAGGHELAMVSRGTPEWEALS